MSDLVTDYLNGNVRDKIIYSTVHTASYLNFEFYDHLGFKRDVNDFFEIDLVNFTVTLYARNSNGHFFAWGDEAVSIKLNLSSLVVTSKKGDLVIGFGYKWRELRINELSDSSEGNDNA